MEGYIVYRDPADAVVPSKVPFARVGDTVFLDTVYSQAPKAGQYPYLDTVLHRFTYRVAILNASMAIGPTLGSATTSAVRPSVKHASGRWKKSEALVPFPPPLTTWLSCGTRSGSPAGTIAADSSGLPGTASNGGSSPTRCPSVAACPRAPASFSSLLKIQDRLWIMADKWNFSPGVAGGLKNSLWNSADGKDWTLVADSLALEPPRKDYQLVAAQGALWMVSGQWWYGGGQLSPVLRSSNGKDWAPTTTGTVYGRESMGAAVFKSRIWSLGNPVSLNHPTASPVDWASIHSTGDGLSWSLEKQSAPFLPREWVCFLTHADALFLIGGVGYVDGIMDFSRQFDDVWTSRDGKDWTLFDAHTPFSPWQFWPGAASFQGRLWIIEEPGMERAMWKSRYLE